MGSDKAPDTTKQWLRNEWAKAVLAGQIKTKTNGTYNMLCPECKSEDICWLKPTLNEFVTNTIIADHDNYDTPVLVIEEDTEVWHEPTSCFDFDPFLFCHNCGKKDITIPEWLTIIWGSSNETNRGS